jgi:hypothetical protein
MKAFLRVILIVLLSGISFAGSGQSQLYGEFSIPNMAEWSFDEMKSSGDYFVFRNLKEGIDLEIKKGSVSCANAEEFNKLIDLKMLDLQKSQWIVDLRRPYAPFPFAAQKSNHLLKLKTKSSVQQKFIMNPVVKGKMYQIEINSAKPLADLPLSVTDLIAGISISDSQAIQNNKSGIVSEPGTKPHAANIPEIAISVEPSGQFDPAISVKAASVPDGDEQSPFIKPAGTPAPVGSDAGWAVQVGSNPKPFLEALEGGRPGGEVSALMALLRQTQGPFDESEEKSMMSQYAAQSASGSSKGQKAIRSQSEHLFKAMVEREMMMQAAREYDQAQAQGAVAGMMGDEDEKQVAAMLGEIQKMMIQESQTSIEAEVKASEADVQVPTTEEVKQELKQENENAVLVVQKLCGTSDGEKPENPNDSKNGNGAKSQEDNTDALVSRYFELRDEHRMLTEGCKGGNNAACTEATAVYREAMDLRKKLEARGINVLTYKKADTRNTNQTPVATTTFKEEPLMVPSKPDPALTTEQNEAVAEHQCNIQSAQRTLNSIRKEMAGEQHQGRREELRMQALHMEQNIHDSKDLIESVRTGQIVKTRGPWDEHAAVVLAETSRKFREEFQRAHQMQASYVRMLNVLNKYNPQEAERYRKAMGNTLVKGIFDPGGFDKAQQAMNQLYGTTKGIKDAEQAKLISKQADSRAYLEMVERHLGYAETLKSGCDKAIFVGTLFTGLAPGLMLSMAYEGATTGIEKGPAVALKNMAIQGGTMIVMAGVMKAGSWGFNKLLNPKVAQGEINSFKNILEANKYQQEMEWNKALVNQFKEKAFAFERCKAAGGKNYVELRKALDESVAAVNSSSLAKRIMKNELNVLQTEIKSGATRDYSKLQEVLSSQKIFDNRLQKSIYPRTDAAMVNKLKSQGYNVESSWFQEYRNACSTGVNADRDLGLLAQFEKQLTKKGQPVSMSQFMDEAQKVYNESYKSVTGRSAKLADQSITTSQHSESFPVSWLQKKVEGPFTTLDPPVTPSDFEKAGKAIVNKVNNALAGPDPAFANMKKAAASLSKDLKSKVFERLKNPPLKNNVSASSRQAALQHWEKVQQALDDFATDKCDPLTTMRKLQQLTGSTSIVQSAGEVQKLLKNLGGGR